jgi:hypothetical protein
VEQRSRYLQMRRTSLHDGAAGQRRLRVAELTVLHPGAYTRPLLSSA